MKNFVKIALLSGVLGFLLIESASAQTKSQEKETIVSVSTGGASLPYKNDAGKEITSKEMFALMGTGDYKIVKAVDKDKKQYWLVKYEQGAGRMQSREFTVTPHKN